MARNCFDLSFKISFVKCNKCLMMLFFNLLLFYSTFIHSQVNGLEKETISTIENSHLNIPVLKKVLRKGNSDNHHGGNNSTKSTTTTTSYGQDNSDNGQWSLQFDPSYFASLNAMNHRPIDPSSIEISNDKTKPSTQSNNMYYYSPESYGKTTHKNHQTGSYTYLYPVQASSSTTSTTPLPNLSNEQYDNHENHENHENHDTETNEYSEPDTSYSLPYKQVDNLMMMMNRNKRPTINDNKDYEESHYNHNNYDGNEEIQSKYYYPVRIKNKHSTSNQHYYYGTDLKPSSTSTNDNSKSQTQSQSQSNTPSHGRPIVPQVPQVEYSLPDEGAIGPDYDPGDGFGDLKYSTGAGSNLKFPSKYYGGGGGSYYPPSSFYPSHYYPSPAYGESNLSSKGSWIGPAGIAGLLFGILPLSILFASMVPALVTVPVVSTATVGRKKRHFQEEKENSINKKVINETTKVLYNPALDIIANYGFSSMQDPNCLQEMFCMLTVEGKKETHSNVIQKILYKIISWYV